MIDDKVLLEDLIETDLSNYKLLEVYYLIVEPELSALESRLYTMIVTASNHRMYCLSKEAVEFLSRVCMLQGGLGCTYEIKIGKRLALVNTKNNYGYFLNRRASRIKVLDQCSVIESIEDNPNAFIWARIGNFIDCD